jgi:copper homeostasis protein (lipoprotein)
VRNLRIACMALAFITFPIDASQADQVMGTATYLQRMALPPQAVFDAEVEDVSRADASAETIGSVRIIGPGNPPIAFAIDIDPQRVDEGHRYSVRATITVDGKLLFTTDQLYPVLTQGNGRNVELLLRQAGHAQSGAAGPDFSLLGQLPASFSGDLPCADCPGMRYRLNLLADQSFFLSTAYSGRDSPASYEIGSWTLSSDHRKLTLYGGQERPLMFRVIDPNRLRKLDLDGHDIESALNYSLTRMEQFEAIEVRLTMRGMYRHLADAGTFTECLTRQRWPVAQEDANATLERAYLNMRREPGEELMVSVEGYMKILPPMEGRVRMPTLVVDRFIGVWPGETCGARFATANLQNTYWKLTALNGKPVFVAKQQREPSLVLHSENSRVAGSGGCNRLMGSYQVRENEVHFGQLAGTMMACPAGMDTEKEFLDTLPHVTRWRIVGEHLEFYDASSTVLGRFEARALR